MLCVNVDDTQNVLYMRKLLILWVAIIATLLSTAEALAQREGYSVSVNPTNVVVSEEFTVKWSVPLGTSTFDDWFGVFTLSAENQQYMDWKYATFRGGETVFDAPDRMGLYNVRYFEIDFFVSYLAAVSETLVVHSPYEAGYTRLPSVAASGPIVAFGDSLTYGEGASKGHDFPSWLAKGLGKPIINKGTIGLTTAAALSRLEADVLSLHPRITIVLLGGNDILQGKDPQKAIANLRTIVQRLYAAGSAVILVGVQGGVWTDRLRDGFHSLWVEERPAYVPNILRGLIGDFTYSSDGVHPNDLGYNVMAARILPTLKAIDALQTSTPGLVTLTVARMGENLAISWPEPSGPLVLYRRIGLAAVTTPAVGVLTRDSTGATFVVKPSPTGQEFFFLK